MSENMSTMCCSRLWYLLRNVICEKEQHRRSRVGITQTGENTLRLPLIIIMFLCTTPIAWAVSYPPHDPSAVIEEVTTVKAIKFHEVQGTSTPLPIPKSWKLISVSPGEKSNSSNLWFQDSDGSIFLLQGFMSQNKLFIHENVYKIPAK
jgi:hypothetical protein